MLLERIRYLAMLVVITFRTDFVPPWARPGHVTLLSLNRLGRRDAADLVAQVAGAKSLPTEVVDRILDKGGLARSVYFAMREYVAHHPPSGRRRGRRKQVTL